jgi:hypothetical protein
MKTLWANNKLGRSNFISLLRGVPKVVLSGSSFEEGVNV